MRLAEALGMPLEPSRRRAFARDSRGTVFVEYAIVTVVGLLVAGVLAGLGASVVTHYSRQRAALYRPYP